MRTAEITKVLKKIKNEDKRYSLGFSRLHNLPMRVRNNISLACVLRGENNVESMKEFLNNLTEQEFINWLSIN